MADGSEQKLASGEKNPPPERVYRHAIVTRATHWLNALCVAFLLMSGLQILNAHPRLYWGQYGANEDAPFIAFLAYRRDDALIGVTKLGPLAFETTGVLGVSGASDNQSVRGFPSWATLPSYRDLAAGRDWHFFFAWLLVLNGLVYLGFSIFNGHVRRDLGIRRAEWRPGHLWRELKDHARLKPPRGEAAKSYNTFQKLAYLIVIFGVFPLVILTGLTMSPGMNAAFPFMLDLFGGRQSARTLHFLAASALVLFFIIHIVQVFVAGAWNEIRSMITGWFDVKPDKERL